MTEKMLRLCSAIHYANLSHAKVARAIGMTPSNFSQKLNRDTFTDAELSNICVAIGAKFHPCTFEFTNEKTF